jgi:hypothetical protein
MATGEALLWFLAMAITFLHGQSLPHRGANGSVLLENELLKVHRQIEARILLHNTAN